MEKIIVPPLKIQGIKTKLVPWIDDFLADKAICRSDLRWVEPFFGSGVVGFNVGQRFNSHYISDKNPYIIQFYEMLRCGVISRQTLETMFGMYASQLKERGDDFYKEIRTAFNTSHDPSNFLFLSRCCFNGLMRFNKKGEFNVPFCKKPDRLRSAYITKILNQIDAVQRVMKVSEWTFSPKDFRTVVAETDENDFIYCDPPYHGRFVDYYGGWTENDEADLYNLLSNTKAKFILSTWHHNDYRKNEMIDKFWKDFNITTREHTYQVGAKEENRKPVVEALVSNF